MNILIAVHDLTIEKWHLMPWRTVVEVVKGLNAQGHTATLLSLDTDPGAEPREFDSDLLPHGTLAISKQKDFLSSGLSRVIESHNADVIFWPVTFREPRWRIRAVGELNLHKIGWFPGGVYSKHDAFYALRNIGLGKTLSYLVDAFYPKRLQMTYMKNRGFDALLTMTHCTTRVAVDNGWSKERIFTVPPGKDPAAEQLGELDEGFTSWLDGSPFYLFMGPPSIIRGVNEVLEAYELASKKNDDIRLVCLFRSDGHLDRDNIERRIKKMDCSDRIYVTWESLPKTQLNSFIRACHAAIMPFLLVPSEIPLAIIETIAFGKPVLTTTCGGTGEYVANFGAASPVGDVNGLSEAMLKMVNDVEYYDGCCQVAAKTYAEHPDWSRVAHDWGEAAQLLLSNDEATTSTV